MTRILIFFTFILFLPSFSNAAQPFDLWLKDFQAEAIQKGVLKDTLVKSLNNLTPIKRVIELDRKQPEGRLTFAQYRKNVVNQTRIKKGRQLYKKHHSILQEVGKKYGVQPQYIVALWGIETNYGGYTGGFSIVQSLATLAHDGRRSAFFRSELLNALKIIDAGHIQHADMKGSWAGAMGQNQFMPSSFLTFAVDHNQDGRKDIWGTLPDVFASTANYLSRSGWEGEQRWGRAVQIPNNIPAHLIDSKKTKPLSVWKELGVKTSAGNSIPVVAGMNASLIQPDGPGSQAYLVYKNHKTLLKWNRSTYFATSVGLLADAIAQ